MSTCEIALGILVGAVASLVLALGHWISTAKALEASKAFDKALMAEFTRVPTRVRRGGKKAICRGRCKDRYFSSGGSGYPSSRYKD